MLLVVVVVVVVVVVAVGEEKRVVVVEVVVEVGEGWLVRSDKRFLGGFCVGDCWVVLCG